MNDLFDGLEDFKKNNINSIDTENVSIPTENEEDDLFSGLDEFKSKTLDTNTNIINKQDYNPERENALSNNELLNKNKSLLEDKLSMAMKFIDEDTQLSEEQKNIARKTLEVNKENKVKDLEDKAFSAYIKDNKKAPSPNAKPSEPDSFVKTITDFQDAVIQPFSPAIELALNYAKTVGSAIGGTVESGINFISGTDFDFYDKKLDSIRAEGDRINKAIDPNNKLALKPTQATDLMASIAIPLNVTSPLKMTILEGLLGYTTEYGRTENFIESTKQGLYQAGAAITGQTLVGELADVVSKRGTSDAVNYLWNKHSTELREASGLGENATKEEVIGVIEDRWLKIMQGSSSKEAKVKSMIDVLGEQGAAYKKAVQQITETELESNVRQPKFSRVQELRDVVEEGNVEAGSKALAKQVGYDPLVTSNRLDEVIAKKGLQGDDATELKNFFQKKLANGDIKNTYSDFINAIKDKYRSEINIESKAIEDLQQSLTERATLSKGLSSAEINISERLSQPMTIDNLLNIKVELNRILRGTNDGLVERNALALRDEVEGILKKTVTPDEFELYKKLETEYALRSSVKSKQETNKIAMNLMEMANGKKTVESVMKDLDTLNTGEFDFKQLEKVIGTKNMAKIETGIVKNLLAGKVDDVSYEVINKSLSNMNFVSKEGKELKSILNEMDNVFKSDNFTTLNNKVLNTSMDNVNALTSDLIAKLKYSASSAIFRSFKRKYFQTKEAIEYRNLEEISNILSGKKTYTRGIVLNGNKVSEDEVLEVARESIMDSYKQQIKQIKPDVTIDEEQLNDVVNNSMLGMSKNYGGKPTNPKTPREGYEKIEESLYGTKKDVPIDESGKLGLGSKYGGKATGTGGVNTEESKKQLNKFMDDIANPKVEVKTEKIEELYSMLEAERKTMYAASKDKEKAWKNAMDIVNEIRKNKTVSPKARDQMIKAVKEYYDLLDDTL